MMERRSLGCRFSQLLLYTLVTILFFLVYDIRRSQPDISKPINALGNPDSETENHVYSLHQDHTMHANDTSYGTPKPKIIYPDTKQNIEHSNGIRNHSYDMEESGIFNENSDFHQLNDADIFLYSAYLDIRYGQQYISVFGMQLGNASLQINACVYVEGISYCGDHVTTIPIYPYWPSLKQQYHAYYYGWLLKHHIVTDKLRNHEKNLKVHLSVNNSFRTTIMALRIIGGFKEEPNRDSVAICVKSVWGSVDEFKLIEWIEMNRELGVSSIVFYDGVTVGRAATVMEHYKSKGFVKRIHFSYLLKMHTLLRNDPIRSKLLSEDLLLEQVYLVSINDCVYRYGNRYKYIMMLDIDEIIVPRGSNSLANLSLTLHSKFPTAAAFSFHTAWHFEFFGETKTRHVSPLLYMQRHLQRTSVMNSQPKPILNTDLCITANWHSVILIPSLKTDGNLYVDWEKYGFVHHFRKMCKYDQDKCDRLLSAPIIDEDLPKFIDPISERIKQVLNELRFS